jgi:hypothetical protein
MMVIGVLAGCQAGESETHPPPTGDVAVLRQRLVISDYQIDVERVDGDQGAVYHMLMTSPDDGHALFEVAGPYDYGQELDWADLVHGLNGSLRVGPDDDRFPNDPSQFEDSAMDLAYSNAAIAVFNGVQAAQGDTSEKSVSISTDTQGCSLGQLTDATSGSRMGHCCDRHDICFKENCCTALSWLGIEGFTCLGCDVRAVLCTIFSFFPGQGRHSSCVDHNTCGQAWGDPHGDNWCICDGEVKPCTQCYLSKGWCYGTCCNPGGFCNSRLLTPSAQCVSTACLSPPPNAPAPGTLVNQGSGQCLGVPSATCAPIQLVQSWCNTSPDQSWIRDANDTIPFAGRLYTRWIDKNSGLCIGVAGGSWSPGAAIVQWPCYHGADQYWTQVDVGGGYSQLVNFSSHQCLGVAGGSLTVNAKLVQWWCNGAADQHWYYNGPPPPPPPPCTPHGCPDGSCGSQDDGCGNTLWCGDCCGGDPCCGDPCCGDPCCGDPCCGDPCCGNSYCELEARAQTSAARHGQPAGRHTAPAVVSPVGAAPAPDAHSAATGSP